MGRKKSTIISRPLSDKIRFSVLRRRSGHRRLLIYPSSPADGRIDKESIDAGEESGVIRYTSLIPVLGDLESSREKKKRRETEFLT